MMFGGDGRDFNHGAAKIALQHFQATIFADGSFYRPDNIRIARVRYAVAPFQGFPFQIRFLCIGRQATASDGGDVFVQQSGAQQLSNNKAQSARRLKLVHVRRTIGVDTAQ